MARTEKSKATAKAESQEPIQDQTPGPPEDQTSDEPTDAAEDQTTDEPVEDLEDQTSDEPVEDLEDTAPEPAPPPVETVPVKDIPDGYRQLFRRNGEVYAVRSHEEAQAVVSPMEFNSEGQRTRPAYDMPMDPETLVEPL